MSEEMTEEMNVENVAGLRGDSVIVVEGLILGVAMSRMFQGQTHSRCTNKSSTSGHLTTCRKS